MPLEDIQAATNEPPEPAAASVDSPTIVNGWEVTVNPGTVADRWQVTLDPIIGAAEARRQTVVLEAAADRAWQLPPRWGPGMPHMTEEEWTECSVCNPPPPVHPRSREAPRRYRPLPRFGFDHTLSPAAFVRALRGGDLGSDELREQLRRYLITSPRSASIVTFAELVERISGSAVGTCASCNNISWHGEMDTFRGWGLLCPDCGNDLQWCDECQAFYNYNDHDFEHDDDDEDDPEVGIWGSRQRRSRCESKHLSFVLPTESGELKNDTVTTVEMPEGDLTYEGVNAVHRLLARWCPHYDYYNPEHRGGPQAAAYETWQVAQSNVYTALMNDRRWLTNAGKLPKRVASIMFKGGIKLTPEQVAEVGNVAQRNVYRSGKIEVEITRDFDHSPERFCNEGSCWWTSESASMCALKACGGFALLTREGDKIKGRAWVVALDARGRLTHDLTAAHSFVTFNGYGELMEQRGAMILSKLVGKPYREMRTLGISPMYINGGSGYVVGPADASMELSKKVSLKCDC